MVAAVRVDEVIGGIKIVDWEQRLACSSAARAAAANAALSRLDAGNCLKTAQCKDTVRENGSSELNLRTPRFIHQRTEREGGRKESMGGKKRKYAAFATNSLNVDLHQKIAGRAAVRPAMASPCEVGPPRTELFLFGSLRRCWVKECCCYTPQDNADCNGQESKEDWVRCRHFQCSAAVRHGGLR